MGTTEFGLHEGPGCYRVYDSKTAAKKAMRRTGLLDFDYDVEFVHQPGGYILPLFKTNNDRCADGIRQYHQFAAEVKDAPTQWGPGEKWERV